MTQNTSTKQVEAPDGARSPRKPFSATDIQRALTNYNERLAAANSAEKPLEAGDILAEPDLPETLMAVWVPRVWVARARIMPITELTCRHCGQTQLNHSASILLHWVHIRTGAVHEAPEEPGQCDATLPQLMRVHKTTSSRCCHCFPIQGLISAEDAMWQWPHEGYTYETKEPVFRKRPSIKRKANGKTQPKAVPKMTLEDL